MSSQPLTLCQDVVSCGSELLEKSQSVWSHGIGLCKAQWIRKQIVATSVTLFDDRRWKSMNL